MASRAQPTPFSEWWWTVDRLTLAALGALMLGGIVLCLAASPPVATRIGLDPFHFVNRQVLFLIPAAGVLIATSFLSPREIRQVSIIVFAVSIALVAITPYFGAEIKGARRWLVILGMNIQPSEFLKPAFVVLVAWLFGESAKRPEMPANTFALMLLITVVALLVMQPDFGQTMLIALVWGALFYMAGMRFIWVIGLAATAGLGLTAAFFTVPHVAQRINRFIDPASGDTFNIDIATESFIRGGWFGRGPGEGTIKRILPEGHTDFVFAVAAEEFGVVLCLILVALFAFIVIRALTKAMRTEDPFIRFAAAGLAILFGMQSTINMAVNLHLIPAKGMTLPFISYGGSSLISLAYGMGMLVALTRERPRAQLPGEIVLGRIEGEYGLMLAPGRAPVLVAAGGTGGHLFPAEALAAALAQRGIPVHLVTDRRAERYGGAFSEQTIHVVSSATVASRNPIALGRTAAKIGRGYFQARALIRQLKPAAVVGFGGYPTVPPVLAAAWAGVPSLIHDANAVIGRANRFLAPRVAAIATSFPDMFAQRPDLAAKATLTGNPVRPAVVAAAAIPYPAPGDPLRLLVFGGSQGARVMADIVPAAIGLLETSLRARLAIVQQARDEDLGRVRGAYAKLAVAAEIAPFFNDLPARMAANHLIVSRSGASTVAELAAIGRPSILVPLPHALDQDQFANAGVLEAAGGAIRLTQDVFTPRRLAAELAALAAAPPRLTAMAAAARSVGRLDAADRLAELVLKVAAAGANQ